MNQNRKTIESIVAVSLLLLGLGLLSAGLLRAEVFQTHPWLHGNLGGALRFLAFSVIGLAIVATAVLACPRRWRLALSGALGLWMLVAFGIGPSAATLFLLGSALATGDLVVGSYWEGRFEPLTAVTLSLLVGITAWVWVIGLLAHIPVNTHSLYVVMFSVPLALGWRRVWLHLRRLHGWLTEPASATLAIKASSGLLVFVLALHVVNVAMPEHTGDGLVSHLRVGAELAYFYRWLFDFHGFVGAVQPMGADWAYGAAYLLGGEIAAKVVNFAFFLLVVALLGAEVRRNYGTLAAVVAVTLYASIPVMLLETATLFVENALTAFLLGAAVILLRMEKGARVTDVLLIGILLGAGLYTKVFAGIYAACLGVLLLYVLYRSPLGWKASARAVLLAAAAGTVVAAPPYVYAYLVTGNPVFPYYNAIFKSPYFESSVNFIHYRPLVSWDLIGQMTFHSRKFYEGGNGTFGFVLVTFLLAGLGLALIRRDRTALLAALLGLGYFYLLAADTAHVRYSLPAMPLLTLVCAGVFARPAAAPSSPLRMALAIGFPVVLLQIWFFPAADWSFYDFHADVVAQGPVQSRQYVYDRVVWRRLVEIVNGMSGGSYVLMPETGAELRGRRLFNSWYNPGLQRRFKTATEPADMVRIFQDYSVTHAMVFHGTPWENDRLMCYLLHNVADLTVQFPNNAYLFTVNAKKLAGFNPAETKAWEAYKAGLPQPGCVPPQ